MVNKFKCSWVIMLLIMGYATNSKAQSTNNDFETRSSVSINYELIKELTLGVTPELRFDNDFSLDQLVFDSELTWKLNDNISLSGGYRVKNTLEQNEDNQYEHRFALSARYKTKIYRFTPSVRLRYTNDADDESTNNYLRYKAGLKYNIRNCKFTPMIATELFHNISDNEVLKTRYSTAVSYKISKKNAISIKYDLDYYLQKYKNKHIISLGYEYNF